MSDTRMFFNSSVDSVRRKIEQLAFLLRALKEGVKCSGFLELLLSMRGRLLEIYRQELVTETYEFPAVE